MPLYIYRILIAKSLVGPLASWTAVDTVLLKRHWYRNAIDFGFDDTAQRWYVYPPVSRRFQLCFLCIMAALVVQ
jgi:hypothetical protein